MSMAKPLSPAAQAVMDAFLADWPDEPLAQDRCSLGAALRAAANQMKCAADFFRLTAIADELEGQ